MRFELTTSSLPRKRSTPELSRLGKKNHIPKNWNVIFIERKTGVEPATFSLEGWRSTNWATSAICVYKLLLVNGVQIYKIFLNLQNKFIKSGESRIRTCEVVRQQSYSLIHLATLESPRLFFINLKSLQRDSNPRPRDYKSRALANWAMEANLRFQKNSFLFAVRLFPFCECKYRTFFLKSTNFFEKNFNYFFTLILFSWLAAF